MCLQLIDFIILIVVITESRPLRQHDRKKAPFGALFLFGLDAITPCRPSPYFSAR